MKRVIIKCINFYRNYLSSYMLPTCKYCPTCSEYTKIAVETKGAARGLFLGIRRILRCNPFSGGGYDPVEPAIKAKEID
ncbi:MAG: membrane protein insertion efficiency factor YidD [Candidatus Omnitrophica bacterium]|nr:membrane protein insertion efficiency factor YidD [Candidatus Omnitrophota bacterium]